ncbi:hypothetical protein [Vulcanisaeta distributa]|nr:hypothetical protein [Vulcanisaeta distributa]
MGIHTGSLAGLNFILGMPGSGKTMLAWALYVEPALMTIEAYRASMGLPRRCDDAVSNFSKVFDEILAEQVTNVLVPSTLSIGSLVNDILNRLSVTVMGITATIGQVIELAKTLWNYKGVTWD